MSRLTIAKARSIRRNILMNHFRDYRKSIFPAFDHDAFMRIISTPPSNFDAKEASMKAAENLYRKGLDVCMDMALRVEAALDIDEDGFVTARNLCDWLHDGTDRYPEWVTENLLDNVFAERGVDYVSVDGVYMLSPSLAMKLADIPCTERGNVAHAYLAGVRGMLARLAEERQKLCLEQAKGEGAREALSDVLVRLLRERAPVAEETGEDDDTL